jgi:hypothetical protein
MVNYRNTYNAMYITLSLLTGMMHKKHFKLKKHVILGFFPWSVAGLHCLPGTNPVNRGREPLPPDSAPMRVQRGLHSFLIQGDECIKEP